MLPADVLKRRDLSATSKLVFAAMSMKSWNSGQVSISQGSIAALCGVSRQQVQFCLGKLSEVGLIEKDGTPRDQVQPYKIARTCPKPKTAPVSVAPGKRIGPALTCGKCHQPTRWLAKTGWCRKCHAEIAVRRIVREEMARTA